MFKYKTTPEAYQFFQRGAEALARVEAAGVRVDVGYLESARAGIVADIEALEVKMKADREVFRAWKRRYGDKTNLGSRNQLSTVLFEDLKIAPKGVGQEDWKNHLADPDAGHLDNDDFLTATKQYRSGKDNLDHIDLDFVRDFVRVENLKKTKKTYLDGIYREMVLHRDGGHYVHPTFPLNFVRSFRSSSRDPNWQNVPNRNPEIAELVRRAYVPRVGNYFVEIDYSTLEVRISCAYHKDPTLIKYVVDDYDMHGDTACQLFLLKPEQVDKKTTRHAAKNQFVFAQFYGDVYFQHAPLLWESASKAKVVGSDLTVRQHLKAKGIKKLGNCDAEWIRENGTEKGTFVHLVKQVQEDFWTRRFKVYDQWRRDWYEAYRRNLGFVMLTGFAVNGVMKKNAVVNYPVQGGAFHCLLWSLIELQREFSRRKFKTLIVGEIHDSIQLDVPPAELQDVLTLCREVMVDRLTDAWDWINVPLAVEVEVSPVGECWHEKKTMVKKFGKWGWV